MADDKKFSKKQRNFFQSVTLVGVSIILVTASGSAKLECVCLCLEDMGTEGQEGWRTCGQKKDRRAGGQEGWRTPWIIWDGLSSLDISI